MEDAVIYLNQDWQRIELPLTIPADEVGDQFIKYIKPDGNEGVWQGLKDIPNNMIYFEFTTNEKMDMLGTWTVWGYLISTDGRFSPGKPMKIHVIKEGTIL